MIHYDLPELKWLQDPPPAKGRRYLNQQEPDTIVLWRNDTKRPAADRFFNPNDRNARSADEEAGKRPKRTSPPAKYANNKYKDLLGSDPLVKSESGTKKVLDVSASFLFFKKTSITFSETPLFAVTDHHSKMCLANLAAMAQIAKGIQEYFSWIIDSINQNLDITSFVGTSPEEPTPPEPHRMICRLRNSSLRIWLVQNHPFLQVFLVMLEMLWNQSKMD